ncbi:tRNA (guanosine(37)-N1)-methyltransferase TrmD [bacterium (Candidatus Gribaldobacteria) CG_4_10_14_0_8_um_filter_33_9]|uniref:tRNA (guanine-N(1)-)-methyltransferase n=1 Tax=bacterium (Candidatus Gribaldobacteria) CG_4_10_14_0_8_um_filter_33_9 TaxID=2014266 RepID=A0A2M7RN77_9BACT|nr:MAG: tRNA (guanosine(37)-N1)-methyltransferase TrmD [bacterium (Candidatus Gribaldobacteria) CG_4_10_14_0_8_um_filter_33_9]
MKFDIITIFPEIFKNYFNHSILKKTKEKKLIKIEIHNLRDFADDNHKTVDDKPFGGGRGMVMKIEPIYQCIQFLKSKIPASPTNRQEKSKVILFTPRGKKFNQKIAYSLSQLDQLILICGRYEGIDERVAKNIADIELSMGDYVLMGGELPALTLIEAVTRLIPGVIGKSELLGQRITKQKNFIEYPQYTRPELFEPKKGIKWQAPKILLSGHQKKIEDWRKKHSKTI